MSKGLEHLSCESRLGELELFRLEMNTQRDIYVYEYLMVGE